MGRRVGAACHRHYAAEGLHRLTIGGRDLAVFNAPQVDGARILSNDIGAPQSAGHRTGGLITRRSPTRNMTSPFRLSLSLCLRALLAVYRKKHQYPRPGRTGRLDTHRPDIGRGLLVSAGLLAHGTGSH